MRPSPSRRPRACSACTRTRSGPGATPAGSATTGSTRAATAATGWATSSGSSPRPRAACRRAPPIPDVTARPRPAAARAAAARRTRRARHRQALRVADPADRDRAQPATPTSGRRSRRSGPDRRRPETLDEVLSEAAAVDPRAWRVPVGRDLRAPRRAARPARPAAGRPCASSTCRATFGALGDARPSTERPARRPGPVEGDGVRRRSATRSASAAGPRSRSRSPARTGRGACS